MAGFEHAVIAVSLLVYMARQEQALSTHIQCTTPVHTYVSTTYVLYVLLGNYIQYTVPTYVHTVFVYVRTYVNTYVCTYVHLCILLGTHVRILCMYVQYIRK